MSLDNGMGSLDSSNLSSLGTDELTHLLSEVGLSSDTDSSSVNNSVVRTVESWLVGLVTNTDGSLSSGDSSSTSSSWVDSLSLGTSESLS